ncbi:hypothetical protein MAR_029199, partial [Mya arenaria]
MENLKLKHPAPKNCSLSTKRRSTQVSPTPIRLETKTWVVQIFADIKILTLGLKFFVKLLVIRSSFTISGIFKTPIFQTYSTKPIFRPFPKIMIILNLLLKKISLNN